jgi:hypothetical protein
MKAFRVALCFLYREVVSIAARPLFSGEKMTAAHCIEGWGVPRVSLEVGEKGKSLLLPGIEIRSPSQ